MFGLDIDDAGEATVMVAVASIPLAEAVDRLLTRRLQHREYVANGQPALVVVGAGIMGCYRCHKEFGVWTARQTIVEGRCGRREIRDQRPQVFAQHRAEALPEVRAAGEQMAQELGLAPGRIFRPYTQTAGMHFGVEGAPFTRREAPRWPSRGGKRCPPLWRGRRSAT